MNILFWQWPKILSKSTMATNGLINVFFVYNYAYKNLVHFTVYIHYITLYKNDTNIQYNKMYIQTVIYSYVGNNKFFPSYLNSWNITNTVLALGRISPLPPVNGKIYNVVTDNLLEISYRWVYHATMPERKMESIKVWFLF